MKAPVLFLLPVLALLALTGCRLKKSPDAGSLSSAAIKRVLYPADIARLDIQRYDSLCRYVFHDTAAVRAFTIGAEDLLIALQLQTDVPAYGHIRAYLGYTADGQFKLFIVPVKGAVLHDEEGDAGQDVLLDKNGQPVHNPGEPISAEYVLDLNAPCPSICDYQSPLMSR